MWFKNSLLAVSLLTRLTAAQWPSPEGAVLKGVRDPSLVRRESDGKYFLFGTNGNGTTHTATSINGPWTQVKGGALRVNQTVVAPQVYNVDGTYYMYYSQHTGPTEDWYYTANLHVASSDTMEGGSWTEHGQLSLPMNNQRLANHASTDGYNILDGSLLVASGSGGASEYYLSFGSYYNGLYQTKLDGPKDLQTNLSVETMNHLEYNSTGGHSTEGSFQFAWPTDGSSATKYYLFFSSGQCCKFAENGVPSKGNAYKVMVCRSDDPTGPFVDADGKDCANDDGGTLVLGSHDSVFAPGGQGVMYSDEVDSVVLYYHYTPTNSSGLPDLSVGDNGARFGWNRMQFTDNGWPELVSGSGSSNTTNTGLASDSMSQTSGARRRVVLPWRGWF